MLQETFVTVISVTSCFANGLMTRNTFLLNVIFMVKLGDQKGNMSISI